MPLCRWIILPLMLLALTACHSAGTATDHSRTADFSRYKTYVWHPQGVAATGIPVQRAQLAQRHLKVAVEQELARQNIRPATYTAPDFVIACTLGATSNAQVRPWGKTTDDVATPGAQPPSERVQYPEGTLILDFVDSKTDELIWRGTAPGAVQSRDDMEAKMRSVVATMMANYPPK